MKNQDYSLSEDDIQNCIPGINVITYPEFAHIDDVDEILDDHKRCIVLFLTKDEYTGHWCALFKNNDDEICWFDSYAIKPDFEKKWLSKNKLIQLKQYPNYLTKLLKHENKQGYRVTFNPYKLQAMKEGVNTCGKHCVSRLIYKDMKIDDYVKMIKQLGKTPDEFVTELVYKLIGK